MNVNRAAPPQEPAVPAGWWYLACSAAALESSAAQESYSVVDLLQELPGWETRSGPASLCLSQVWDVVEDAHAHAAAVAAQKNS